MTQNRRNTKSAATTMAFAERRYTVDESHVHARVYNILKARRGVAGCGEGGCKVLSGFASRQILPLSRSKMARAEKKEEGKEKRERQGRAGRGKEKCIIFTLDAYPVAHGFLSLYRGSLLREK